MARLNVEGVTMYETMCRELSVPYIRNGSLVVAFDAEQQAHIERLMERGIKNGVPGLRILSKEELSEMEPAVNPSAVGALYAETAGITDPMILTVSLLENAVVNGAECFTDFEVVSIENINGCYHINSDGKTVSTRYVVNAAGVFSDKIHNMAASPSFAIRPRRGQYYLLDKSESGIVNRTVFPCPTKIGKGILVAPTAHGNVILGPASDDIADREDLGTTDAVLGEVRAGARRLVPKVSLRNNIRVFAGMRAEPDKDDFVIGEAKGAPGFIDAAGIKSPGLSAAPAIAQYVAGILAEKGLTLAPKKSFDPRVERKPLNEASEAEQIKMINESPDYGKIVCRCEKISEGEIIEAIRRKPGAVSIDGVKRRCRAGMGRCQGGFCGPKVAAILAREQGVPLDKIVQDTGASHILTGKTK